MLLFELGQVTATPAVLERTTLVYMAECLHRHVAGDWGDLDEHDKQANDDAVRLGNRILSAYPLGNGEQMWIITEADRSVTTFLLPSDY